MECNISIGDSRLMITQRHAHTGDQTHWVQYTDVWGSGKTDVAVVDDEPLALDVLEGFLNREGPTGLFKELFPEA